MIIDLGCVGRDDLALVGGKAANLGELLRAGLPVPDGFCLTTDAYRTAFGNPMPETLASELLAATAQLGGPVAVRSSATAEDLPEASFAGQHVVTIESAFGLGESVVSRAVTPDAHTVGRTLRRRLGHKTTRIDLRPDGGTRTTTVADPTAPSITDRQVRRIAALAKRVERHYGQPMDIEWAVEGEQVWLLQARPITTVAPKRPGLLSRVAHDDLVEHFPAPYPLDLAIVEMLIPILHDAGARIGVDLPLTDDLLTMDDDGVARVGYPRVRVTAPWRALRPGPRLDPPRLGAHRGVAGPAAHHALLRTTSDRPQRSGTGRGTGRAVGRGPTRGGHPDAVPRPAPDAWAQTRRAASAQPIRNHPVRSAG